MNARALLDDRIAHHDLCPGAADVDEWLALDWVRVRIGARLVPLIPLWGLRKALVAHDLHHAVLGYPTTWRGELEIAAWELASGGCGWNLPFWGDRLLGLGLGLVFCPRATLRAARAGVGRRNLFGRGIDELLAADVDALRRAMRLDTRPDRHLG